MAETRYALCGNNLWDDDLRLTVCPQEIPVTAEDAQIKCPACGARCGALVAKFIDGGGPFWQAEVAFAEAVRDEWVRDHDAGHPAGRGNCPFCPAQGRELGPAAGRG